MRSGIGLGPFPALAELCGRRSGSGGGGGNGKGKNRKVAGHWSIDVGPRFGEEDSALPLLSGASMLIL